MFFKKNPFSLYVRIATHFFEMPFYAVIFRASKTGTVADNWEIARGLRDATPNSYAKKFDSTVDAEKYIKDFKYRIVSKTDNVDGFSNQTVKRKRPESPKDSTSVLKDHIKKIKTAFDDLQAVLPFFPRLSKTCIDQVKTLNENVSEQLNDIFGETNIGLLLENEESIFNIKKSVNSCFDLHSIQPSVLEEAKKSFTLNDRNEVIVYTDGACSNNGYNGASAGAGVWFGYGHPLNLSIKVPGKQTNNNAEIFATIQAIECVRATGLAKVNINTDSDFVIKSINEWVPRWQSNGWKTSSGAEVKNKEMFLKLLENIKIMEAVEWTHVPGHKGNIGNEEADKLARLGATM